MDEEEKKRNYNFLLEQLYSNLLAAHESTLPNIKEIQHKMLNNFYEDFHETFNIKNIDQIIQDIKDLDQKIKSLKEQEGLEER